MMRSPVSTNSVSKKIRIVLLRRRAVGTKEKKETYRSRSECRDRWKRTRMSHHMPSNHKAVSISTSVSFGSSSSGYGIVSTRAAQHFVSYPTRPCSRQNWSRGEDLRHVAQMYA